MSASTTIHPTSEAEATDLTHILGDELRQARRHRRWTRKELRGRLQHRVSLPALASYELGTRQCSVNRFVQICEALETAAPELLAHSLRRLASTTHVSGLRGTAPGRSRRSGPPILDPFADTVGCRGYTGDLT